MFWIYAIGQNSPGNYVLCHDEWRTSYSLAQAIKEVTNFIDSTDKEIVILDFHRFVKLGDGSYDYSQLKNQITSALSGYILPNSLEGKTLESIWSTSPGNKNGRVVIAWNGGNRDSSMWSGVDQSWYQDAKSLLDLYKCIKRDMHGGISGLWAACSFMVSSVTATPHSNAASTNPTITNWYFGGSRFCESANIISVDYFESFTNVVQASIIGSLLKAGKKK